MGVDSVFVHKMWNDHERSKMVRGGVPGVMLSDGDGKVASAYGFTLRMRRAQQQGHRSYTSGWKPGKLTLNRGMILACSGPSINYVELFNNSHYGRRKYYE